VTRNLEFMEVSERNMRLDKKIAAVRADRAAYQAAIFSSCEETGKVFAVGADQDAAVRGCDQNRSRSRLEAVPRQRNRRDGS
jgi:hypothetical protein